MWGWTPFALPLIGVCVGIFLGYYTLDAHEKNTLKKDDSPEKSPSYDLKMVFVVRSDLGMSKGKVAAQCCHACLGAYKEAMRAASRNVAAWHATGEKKITLSISGKAELEALAQKACDMGLPHHLVRDAGHTQVAPGSETVLGIGPAPVAAIDAITGGLKLY